MREIGIVLVTLAVADEDHQHAKEIVEVIKMPRITVEEIRLTGGGQVIITLTNRVEMREIGIVVLVTLAIADEDHQHAKEIVEVIKMLRITVEEIRLTGGGQVIITLTNQDRIGAIRMSMSMIDPEEIIHIRQATPTFKTGKGTVVLIVRT
jgi:molybdenum cofactor biosynthesis enzyme MoaA